MIYQRVVNDGGGTKPWGTAHALWAARECIHEPFAMINADDFYGCDALLCIAQHLKGLENDSLHACLVGYPITRTLSKNGSVLEVFVKLGISIYAESQTNPYRNRWNLYLVQRKRKRSTFRWNRNCFNELNGFSSAIFTVLNY